MEHRVCIRCGVSKILHQEFYRNAGCNGGFRPTCKECVLAVRRLKKPADTPRKVGSAIRRSLGPPPPGMFWCIICKVAKIASKMTNPGGRPGSPCKGCHRQDHLMRSYGISQKQYDEILSAQCGACYVCGELEEYVGTRRDGHPVPLAVHHDHSTGRVIALVCRRCNSGLGMFEDRPELLRRAASVHEGM